VIYGLPETEKETLGEQLKATDALLSKMDMKNVLIDDLFRLGRKTPNTKARPLLVKFVRKIDKKLVLSTGRRKLMKGDPRIDDDKSPMDRAIERKLFEKFKEVSNGDKAMRRNIWRGTLTITKGNATIGKFTINPANGEINEI